MNMMFLLALSLLMPAEATAMTDAGESARMVRLPKAVIRLLERHESCVHFAGEFNGDGSERDRDVNATMVELRCDEVEQDEAALRRKYARRPDALKALDAVDGF
jgi:hypothetical protein